MRNRSMGRCFIAMGSCLMVAYLCADENLKNSLYKKITILTAPIGHSGNGHYAVTRSLITGFTKLGVNFNHNPAHIDDVGDVVIALSDVTALRQAIYLKQQGRIRNLLAGPTLMVRADEHNNIASSKEIDTYLINSEWTKIAYEEEAPLLRERLAIWYAGVDASYWCPPTAKNNKTRQVIVYWKTESESFCYSIESLLNKYGWVPTRIKYGSYNAPQFKDLLSSSAFAVFISVSESQGLALAEAWSMDVPTIVWNPKKLIAHGREYSVVSACPYLTEYTGVDWQELSQLEEILQTLEQRLVSFQPRKWVLRNMTDEASARLLLDIIAAIPNVPGLIA